MDWKNQEACSIIEEPSTKHADHGGAVRARYVPNQEKKKKRVLKIKEKA